MLRQTIRFNKQYLPGPHQGAAPAPGGGWGAETQNAAKLCGRADPCGQSGAPDQSPWCGELSCSHDL